MTLDDGYKPTNLERSTAIELEARRLRVTYGVLSQELERDYGWEKEIVKPTSPRSDSAQRRGHNAGTIPTEAAEVKGGKASAAEHGGHIGTDRASVWSNQEIRARRSKAYR